MFFLIAFVCCIAQPTLAMLSHFYPEKETFITIITALEKQKDQQNKEIQKQRALINQLVIKNKAQQKIILQLRNHLAFNTPLPIHRLRSQDSLFISTVPILSAPPKNESDSIIVSERR